MNNSTAQEDNTQNGSSRDEGSEEITLYSAVSTHTEEDENNVPDTQAASLKFTQLDKARSLGKKFILYDNKQLSVSEYQLKSKRQYWVELSYLQDKAQSKWHIAWAWFWMWLGFSILSAIAGSVALYPIFAISVAQASAAALILACVSVLCLFALYRKSHRVLRLFTLNGNLPVIELLNNNPNRKVFNQFVQALQKRIQLAHSKQYLSKDERLAAELAQHRQLKQHKIITAEQYENAKNRLFSLHNA
jgi:hypothetical protein